MHWVITLWLQKKKRESVQQRCCTAAQRHPFMPRCVTGPRRVKWIVPGVHPRDLLTAIGLEASKTTLREIDFIFDIWASWGSTGILSGCLGIKDDWYEWHKLLGMTAVPSDAVCLYRLDWCWIDKNTVEFCGFFWTQNLWETLKGVRRNVGK